MNYKLYWELTNEGGARLLRAFGGTPEPRFPAEIEGRAITEIGDYCFAAQAHLPAEYRCSYVQEETEADGAPETAPDGEMQAEPGADGVPETAPDREADVMPGADGAPGAEPETEPDMELDGLPEADGTLAELAGAYITRVTLPEGVKKIGNFAFYNATALAELELGSGTETLGSDAFMNCRSLSRLLLHADPGQKTGLRLLLAQLSSDLEVALSGENGVWAKLLFPEYYESYDEIAPAHIFGRNIVGEGFRARQSFREGVLDFAQYDKIFPQACVDESEVTLGRLALDRVRYAAELSETPRGLYEAYLKAHGGYLIRRITDDRDLELAEYCCSRKFVTREDVAACAVRAGKVDWAEGAAALLHLMQQYFPEKTPDERYSFDDF
ncbi:leucine-rich repeat protein [Roseburia hominis]|jgi:hypothetical protein|uniref:leucine-rich repeat protein n=1 Tax=Roseburia hominis TaxID=301301 RepID=UPI003AF626D1